MPERLPVTIALVTCDRHDYTKTTLESLAKHNDLSRFRLIHIDDASTDARIEPLAASYGFELASDRAPVRRGNARSMRMAVDRCQTEFLMILENDWESARPIPADLAMWLFEYGVCDAFRLYGAYKGRGRRYKCRTRHEATGDEVVWRAIQTPFEGAVEVGRIHWGFPPSIIRTETAACLVRGIKREKDMFGRCVGLVSARVTENVFYHIGDAKTPATAASTFSFKSYADYKATQRKLAGRTRYKTRRPDRQAVRRMWAGRIGAGQRIMCIGARDNAEVQDFIDAGHNAIGIDLDAVPPLVKSCDMSKMQAVEAWRGAFDVVVAIHSLEHCLDWNGLLAGLRHLLRERGRVLCTIPVKSRPDRWDCRMFPITASGADVRAEAAKMMPGFELVWHDRGRSAMHMDFIRAADPADTMV